jgi:hypothetical protein
VSEPAPQNVTKLLVQWSKGAPGALEALVPLVYDELRRLTRYYLKQEKQSLHLKGLPVIARPDTFFYRSSKFVRRHKAVRARFVGYIKCMVRR